jgi:hypothetical protein
MIAPASDPTKGSTQMKPTIAAIIDTMASVFVLRAGA